MQRQRGFTLLEVVVVIVILGILAVTAAPRFLNLPGDTRKASLQGLQGAMRGSVGTVYGQSTQQGVEQNASGSVRVNGATVNVVWGYPAATAGGIGAVLALDTNSEWTLATNTDHALVATLADESVSGAKAITATDCYLIYKQASSSGAFPTVELTDSGC